MIVLNLLSYSLDEWLHSVSYDNFYNHLSIPLIRRWFWIISVGKVQTGCMNYLHTYVWRYIKSSEIICIDIFHQQSFWNMTPSIRLPVNEMCVDISWYYDVLVQFTYNETWSSREFLALKIISQMYSSGCCSSSWQPYFNNDTAGGKQGTGTGGGGGGGGVILLLPDVSSTLHYQNEWFNINGSEIY